MRAYRVLDEGKGATWDDTPVPRLEAGHVLLRMRAAGLCRTDLEIVDHGAQFVPWAGPYTLGHENVGTVVEKAADVEGVEIGEVVLVNSVATCGRCENCLRGEDNYCLSRLGFYGTSNNGGFAEFLLARAHDVVSIGGLDPIAAVPLADAGLTAYGAVQHILPAVTANGSVAVIGVGGLGGIAIQLLRAQTTAQVIAVDLASRHDHALRQGAHAFVETGDDAASTIMALTGGVGADAVLDFVGMDSTLATAASVARSLGRVALIGTAGGTLPFGIMTGQPGVQYSTHLGGTLGQLHDLVRLLERGIITTDVAEYAFSDLERAFDDLRNGRVFGRAVVTFPTEPAS